MTEDDIRMLAKNVECVKLKVEVTDGHAVVSNRRGYLNRFHDVTSLINYLVAYSEGYWEGKSEE